MKLVQTYESVGACLFNYRNQGFRFNWLFTYRYDPKPWEDWYLRRLYKLSKKDNSFLTPSDD